MTEEEIKDVATNWGYMVAGGCAERPLLCKGYVEGAKWMQETMFETIHENYERGFMQGLRNGQEEARKRAERWFIRENCHAEDEWLANECNKLRKAIEG